MQTTALGWAFDIVLALTLPVLAWRILTTRDLYRAVILFIAFGLLVALSWVRLDAPDIALAEAALGAGLTGALFLNTVGALARGGSGAEGERRPGNSASPAGEPVDRVPRGRWMRLALLAPASALGAALGWAVLVFPEPAIDLARRVDRNLPAAGVEQPVTAVLLNFRSYDTLLEVGVLLLAILAVWSLDLRDLWGGRLALSKGTGVLDGLVRLLTPVMIVCGGYLLWAGTQQPGGAFQAGAVLGALGVLLVLSGLVAPPLERDLPLRVGLAVGFGVFLTVGCAVLLVTGTILEYPPALNYYLILAVELVLTVSIALTLAALFVTAPPPRKRDAPGPDAREPEGSS